MSNQNNHVLFTVQTQEVVILKSIYGAVTSEVRAFHMTISVGSTAGTAALLIEDALITGEPFSWEGWVVLELGDYVICNVLPGAAAIWGSGALLAPRST